MRPPQVSVLMPVHNAGQFLQPALDSIIGQAHPSFEVIVVDDASSDGSPDVLARYASTGQNVTVLRNPTNLGVAASLNRGLEACTGDFVARADADDLYDADRLRIQAEHLIDNPEIGLLGSGYHEIDEQGARLRTVRIDQDDAMLRFELMFGCVFVHPTVMFRRSLVLASGGYNENVHARGPEDYELWARLSKSTRLGGVPDPLVKYRIHPSSVIGRFSPEQWQLYFTISARLMSESLDKKVDARAAQSAAMLRSWSRPPPPESVDGGIQLLSEIREQLQSTGLRSLERHFQHTTARGLIEQSRLHTHAHRDRSKQLLKLAMEWQPSILVRRAALAQVLRLSLAASGVLSGARRREGAGHDPR